MAEMFANGSLVGLILILTVIEAALLAIYWRYARRGVAPLDILPNLLAGAFLLIALRLSLAGADWQLCCASLAAAGLAHIFDLARRWR